MNSDEGHWKYGYSQTYADSNSLAHYGTIYCTHTRALTDINDRGKVGLPEQRSRATSFPEVINALE